MKDRAYFLLLLLVLLFSINSSAQIIQGRLVDQVDGSYVMLANIVLLDSSDKVISGVKSDESGKFVIRTSSSVDRIRIFYSLDYSEIHIHDLGMLKSDSIDLGPLPLFASTEYIDVQFNELSEQEERRKQRELVKAYNEKLRRSKDLTTEIDGTPVKLHATTILQEGTERLKLVYVLKLKEIK